MYWKQRLVAVLTLGKSAEKSVIRCLGAHPFPISNGCGWSVFEMTLAPHHMTYWRRVQPRFSSRAWQRSNGAWLCTENHLFATRLDAPLVEPSHRDRPGPRTGQRRDVAAAGLRHPFLHPSFKTSSARWQFGRTASILATSGRWMNTSVSSRTVHRLILGKKSIFDLTAVTLAQPVSTDAFTLTVSRNNELWTLCEELASQGLHFQRGLARRLVCRGPRLSKAARAPCRQLWP